MRVSREVQVRMKHVLGSQIRWSRNEQVVHYRVWTTATERPATDEEPAHRAITCGDCAAVVTFRLLTADRTRRRRRILGGLTLVAWLLLPVTVTLIVRGTFGPYDIVALLVVGALAPALTVMFAGENGLRALSTTGPDGRPTRRHDLDAVHAGDRTRF